MDTETLTPDVEESALRELGVQTDAEQGRADAEATKEAPDPASREATQDSAPPPEPEQPKPGEQVESKAQLPRDETGKFTKQGQRPETDYSRAQKEQERKDRSWAALQAEKENFRRLTSQYQEQQRIQQLEAARQTFQPLKKEGLTAQEYYDGYQRFRQNGDYENAARALETAIEIQNAEQSRVGQVQAVEAEYQWRKGMEEAGQANPEVFNPESPVAAHIQRIIAENPWIYHVPQGFQRAAEVATMLVSMDQITELQDENESLRAQLEKYQRKSQPGKSGYAAPRTGDKEFDDMNLDEMESHLKSLTQEADNYR